MKRKRAFTIVELVIVIAVVAILAAVLIPTLSTIVRKAKDSYLLQNDRNELLQNYLESVLEGDGWTAPTKEVTSETDDDGIETLKEELSTFLTLVEQHIMFDNYLGGAAVRGGLLNEEGYQLVGYSGSGIAMAVFSYEEKYNITFVDEIGHLSYVKIRLYDDINTSSGESIYYGLKAERVEEETTTTTDSEQVPKYTIEVVKITEPQG